MSLPAPQSAALDAASFFDEALAYAAAESASDLKAELLSLLAREASLLTMGDSSLRIERAEALLHSLRFSMGLFLKRHGMDEAVKLLQAEALRTLLRQSRVFLKSQTTEAHTVYDALVSLTFTTKNRAYNDTILALSTFFIRYDTLQAAYDIPCSIDYPLSSPIGDLEGIEYIGAYLRRLYAETRFLACFPAHAITELLASLCPGPDEQLINLFEPVFFNAMGRNLLQNDPLKLDLPPVLQESLFGRLGALDAASRASAVRQAAARLCEELGLTADEETVSYLLLYAQKELTARIGLSLKHGAPQVFTAFAEKPQPAARVRFRPAPPMPDEVLRALIDELSSCRFLSDKLTMLSREVHSLEDWLEVVPLCFSGEEYDAVFSRLSVEELAAVARRIETERAPDEAPSAWQSAFLRHTAALSAEQAARFQSLLSAKWEK